METNLLVGRLGVLNKRACWTGDSNLRIRSDSFMILPPFKRRKGPLHGCDGPLG